ncbi:MAG: NAD(P)-dependent oxidoreductase [Myxococcota bacterium]
MGYRLSGRRVAVTGATGFIGRYLVRALQSRGAEVVAVVRNPDKVPAFQSAPDVELRQADLRDRPALERAFRGVDAAIHNAALISVGRRSREELVASNAEGTRNVMESLATAGVLRVALTSSALVYRPRRDQFYRVGDPIWDRHDRPGRTRFYGLSKAVAETIAVEFAAKEGIRLSIARPHLVFGAFDQGSFTRYLRLLMKPPVTVWFTHIEMSSIYAGDLAEGMLRMLESAEEDGGIYNTTAPGRTTWWDHLRAFREAGGPRPLVLPVPIPVRRVFDPGSFGPDLAWYPRPMVDAFRETLALERGEAPEHDPGRCGPWPHREARFAPANGPRV